MNIQVYTLDSNDITWSKDGTVGVYDGTFGYGPMESERSKVRLERFLAENKDIIDKNEWLLSLSSVFYVPFVRFGDEIVEEKPEKKEKTGENKRISDENTSEAGQ